MSSDRRLVKINIQPPKKDWMQYLLSCSGPFFLFTRKIFMYFQSQLPFSRVFCFINFRLGHWNPLCFFFPRNEELWLHLSTRFSEQQIGWGYWGLWIVSQGGYIHLQVAGGTSREGSIPGRVGRWSQMKQQRVEPFQTTLEIQFFIGWMFYFFPQNLHFCLSRMKFIFLTRPVQAPTTFFRAKWCWIPCTRGWSLICWEERPLPPLGRSTLKTVDATSATSQSIYCNCDFRTVFFYCQWFLSFSPRTVSKIIYKCHSCCSWFSGNVNVLLCRTK